WAHVFTIAACGALGAAALLLGVYDLALGMLDPRAAGAAGTQGALALVACGGAALALVWPGARGALARVVPIDSSSPVHLLAFVLTLVLFGFQLQSALGGALQQEAGSAQPLSRLDLVLGAVPV